MNPELIQEFGLAGMLNGKIEKISTSNTGEGLDKIEYFTLYNSLKCINN